MSLDNTFERVQEKIRLILGPLCKAWYRLEEARSESSNFDADELLHYVDQTVMLIGQASNSVSYNRRKNVLTAVGQENLKAKTVLKHQSKLLEKPSTGLFGKAFRENIKDTVKAKKESKEIYDKKDDPFSEVKTNGPSKEPRGPVSKDPLSKSARGYSKDNNNRGGFSQKKFNNFNNNNSRGFNQQRQFGKQFFCETNDTFQQHGKSQVFSRNCSNERVRARPPFSSPTFSNRKVGNFFFRTGRKLQATQK